MQHDAERPLLVGSKGVGRVLGELIGLRDRLLGLPVTDRDYVVVGATPDDHTRQCAAAALGVELALHPEAARLIEQMERAGLVSPMGSNGNREVIVPANTYIATIVAITENGLAPVLVEPDPATFNVNHPCAQIDQKIRLRTGREFELFFQNTCRFFEFMQVIGIQIGKGFGFLSPPWCGKCEQEKNGAEVHRQCLRVSVD